MISLMEESARKIVAEGGRAEVATFDITDSERLRSWIQGAADDTGRLDVLVNNAGLGVFGSTIADGDPSALDRSTELLRAGVADVLMQPLAPEGVARKIERKLRRRRAR